VEQRLKHMPVLNSGYWSSSQRMQVWPETFRLDSETFGKMKKKLEDPSVEREEKVNSVILWMLGIDKLEVRPWNP
jgi:hypothetical protein